MGYDLIEYAPTPLGKIAYHQTGSGEPLFLSHGGESHKAQYESLAPLLAPGIRAISYDQRDIADSFFVDQPYTFADLADDLARFMDALGLEKAHIGGFSFGGMLSLTMAVRHSDRVHTLIAGTAPDARQPRTEFLTSLLGMSPTDRADAMMKALLSEDGQRDVGLTERTHAVLSRGYSRPGSFRHAAIGTFAVADELAAITAPTLLIYGSDDPLAPPSNGESIAATIPDARLAVIEGARHGVYFEFKEQTAELINDFVLEHPVGS